MSQRDDSKGDGSSEPAQFVQRPLKAQDWRRRIMRDGALDYRDIPSVAGEQRLAHTGPTTTRSRRDGNT